MNRKSKKEFAGMLNCSTRELSVYIARGKVICEGDLIDIDDETNRAFFEKKMMGKGKKDGKRIPVEDLVNEEDNISDDEDSEIPSYTVSEQRLIHERVLKTRKEREKLIIEIQKKRGEVIPSDLMPPIVLQHNQSIITAIKNQQEEWLRKIGKRHNLTVLEIADAKSELIGWINEAMKKATRLTISSLDNIVQDYAEKRGIGQREN